MCKYSYVKDDGKIYCSHENVMNSKGLCICQRYCNNKSQYIPHNQDRNHCKYYSDS